jgi:hypothetical protein
MTKIELNTANTLRKGKNETRRREARRYPEARGA